MDDQFLAYIIVLGISVLTNCIYCYSSCRGRSRRKAAKKREKIQELNKIATNSDLPKWVVNEYLKKTNTSLQV